MLTAASVLRKEIGLASKMVLVGTSRLGGNRTSVKSNITQMIIHPNFNASRHGQIDDIAILVLGAELEFNEVIKPIALPSPGALIGDGAEGVISGWGVNNGPMALDLLFAKIKTVNQTRCEETHIPANVTANIFCAIADQITPCYGDYGGPFVTDNVLHGIISWGGPCGISICPAVFTRVAKYVEWIRNETQKVT